MRILSIDGGGYLGLATAAYIEGMEQHLGVPFHEQFDLYCGTSTGAILALALATGRTGSELVSLYKKLGRQVFGKWGWIRNAGRWVRCVAGTKYGNRGLQEALTDAFADMTLADLLEQGKRVLITSFCLSAGTPRVFKTDHAPHLTGHGQYKLRDVALASAAAPVYFPLVQITNPANGVTEAFCDGGVAANAPALLGFTEAVAELGGRPSEVRLLSLSTPRMDLSEPRISRCRLRRSVGKWMASGRLVSMLIDANSMMSHEALLRIVRSYGTDGPLYVRHELRNTLRLPLDRADGCAMDELVRIGATAAAGARARAEVGTFFVEASA